VRRCYGKSPSIDKKKLDVFAVLYMAYRTPKSVTARSAVSPLGGPLQRDRLGLSAVGVNRTCKVSLPEKSYGSVLATSAKIRFAKRERWIRVDIAIGSTTTASMLRLAMFPS
jgi:hypothetical protein